MERGGGLKREEKSAAHPKCNRKKLVYMQGGRRGKDWAHEQEGRGEKMTVGIRKVLKNKFLRRKARKNPTQQKD